jgi:O-antigen ligase
MLIKPNISGPRPPSTLPEEEMEIIPLWRMNLFLALIIVMAIIPWIYEFSLFGFWITGWAWVIPATIAFLICATNIGRITFPLGIWLPWISLICLYWFLGRDNPNALQSLLQMLSPLVVGCAVSIFRSDILQLENIITWITRLSWITWIIFLIRVPILMTGILPNYGLMTSEMIGLLLLGACYASFYACGSSRHLWYYLSMIAMTIISLTRGPVIAMSSCLPLTIAPLRILQRVTMCVAIIVVAIIVFNTDRMQQRMFSSGSGEISDVRLDNTNFQTNARLMMWNILWEGVKEKPWFGNGWNVHRTTLLSNEIPTYLPHNDWLKLLYDVGIVGVVIYLLTMIFQVFFLARIAHRSIGSLQMLAYGATTAFVPYAVIMFTDNIVLYVQYFGNLQFALIGIIYGALQRERNEEI